MRIWKEILIRMYADVPIGGINISNGYGERFILKVKANGEEKEIELGARKLLFIEDFFSKESEYEGVVVEIWPKEDDICE